MNCWFCQQSFLPQKCYSPICQPKRVTYFMEEDHKIYAVEFMATFHTKDDSRTYSIAYYERSKLMIINQNVYLNEKMVGKEVFNLPYNSLILTPQNVNTRLPTLITFS